MVSYATRTGLIREFGDIEIISMKNGVVELKQDLLTYDKNGDIFEEERFAILAIDPQETEDQLFHRLNDYSNTIITPSGTVSSNLRPVTVKPTVE